MKTVADLLKGKKNVVWSVSPENSVHDALQLMADKDIGAVLVMEGKDLLGIFSERDYARRILLQGRRSKETPVRDVMTDEVVCIIPERTVEECMALMTEHHIRHLPVVIQNEIQGVISVGDIVHAVIGEKEFMIQQLETYIRGR